jgi:hypothetical protein
MELYRAQTQKVYNDFFYNNNPIVLDELPSAFIVRWNLDPNTGEKIEEVLSAGPAEFVDEEEGMYAFTIENTDLNFDEEIKVTWTYIAENQLISITQGYDVITPYVNMSEAYKRLGFGKEPKDSNYVPFDEMKHAESFARYMIEIYTGQKFGKYNKTVEVIGQNSDVLYVDDRILQLDKMYVNNELVIDDEIEFNRFGYNVKITDTNFAIKVNSNDDIAEGAKLDLVYKKHRAFMEGNAYKIIGIFGYEVVPPKIQYAAIMLMKDYFGKDNIWRARYVKNVSFGDTDMEFSSLAFRGTGNFFVDKLLSEYRTPNLAVI